ncbi:MAG: hypothetical protein C9356_16990 [Oleiphilus sp.]|nr:MAG: hypothetical protein C9356_16990 [Oleiphilus sp.]
MTSLTQHPFWKFKTALLKKPFDPYQTAFIVISFVLSLVQASFQCLDDMALLFKTDDDFARGNY